MPERPTTDQPSSGPDLPDDEPRTRASHDQQGRRSGAPYVPGGRDAQGQLQPSVPHEGLLGRLGAAVVTGQSIVLLVVAVAGYVVSRDADFLGQPDTSFLALRLNAAHSTLLLATGVLGLAALYRRRSLRWFLIIQTVLYFVLFAFGSALSVNTGNPTVLDLNTADHVLHLVLALLGFATMMITSARIIEPPPGPLPYPDVPQQ